MKPTLPTLYTSCHDLVIKGRLHSSLFFPLAEFRHHLMNCRSSFTDSWEPRPVFCDSMHRFLWFIFPLTFLTDIIWTKEPHFSVISLNHLALRSCYLLFFWPLAETGSCRQASAASALWNKSWEVFNDSPQLSCLCRVTAADCQNLAAPSLVRRFLLSTETAREFGVIPFSWLLATSSEFEHSRNLVRM